MHRIPAIRILIAQRVCSSAALTFIVLAAFAFPAGAVAIPATAAQPQPQLHAQDRQGPSSGKTESRGLRLSTEHAFAGLTLLSPLKDTKTYLLNMRGQVAHTWESDLPPGNSVYLRPNGNLLRSARPLNNPVFSGGGEGGRIREYSWAGELLWELDWNDKTRLQHHDFELLPNGNLLLISWELKTSQEAAKHGRRQVKGNRPAKDGQLQEQGNGPGFWPDYLVEIKPTGSNGAEIVWEWHAWDHLIQKVDADLANFGEPAEFPQRIDINGDFTKQQTDAAEKKRLQALGYLAPDAGKRPNAGPPGKSKGTDWMHTNAVDYNPELDLIVLSVRRMNEVWVIDHSTTTAEARTETGGRYGQGGGLLFRWGNPRVYGRGSAEDQKLFGQHDSQWIAKGNPGAGNLLIFDNGAGRPGGKWSRVLELAVGSRSDAGQGVVSGAGPGAKLGDKPQFGMNDDGHYLPDTPTWSYTASNPGDFYSSFISGAQRLPNGNTLICEGDKGRVFEVTSKGTIVWEYWNPFGEASVGRPKRTGPKPGGPRPGARPSGPPPKGRAGGPQPKALFRATRIPLDFPGLLFGTNQGG